MQSQPRPTGSCWCGCGEETKPNRFFLPGHDSTALFSAIRVEYGDVPGFLQAHGYGPGGKNAIEAREPLERGPKEAQSK